MQSASSGITGDLKWLWAVTVRANWRIIFRFEAGSAREVEEFKLLQIFLSLCQTVAYAHSHGVLHRDLKPENVMLGPYGETILLDWGIAKVMGQPDTGLALVGQPVTETSDDLRGFKLMQFWQGTVHSSQPEPAPAQ